MGHYLVTGGAGFIGSHLVDTLVSSGETLRVVDDLSTGLRENISTHIKNKRVDFMEGSLATPGVASRAVDGVEYVFHLAAVPSVPRSINDPVGTHRANVDSTLMLLMAARDAGVKRLVFASSSSVYGNSPTLPKHEKMPTQPLSPYAVHKLIGEHYVKLFYLLYGLDTVALRFFNVFGPRQNPDSLYSGVISLFTAALSQGRQPIIHGDGEQTRDFTYVSDVVAGVMKACHADNVGGQVINLACGGRISVNHLFEALKDVIGSSEDPIYKPIREGDVRDSQADVTLARKLLGFQSKVAFEEGLRQTIGWYRA